MGKKDRKGGGGGGRSSSSSSTAAVEKDAAIRRSSNDHHHHHQGSGSGSGGGSGSGSGSSGNKRSSSSSSSTANTNTNTNANNPAAKTSLKDWLLAPDRQGVNWVLTSLWMGGLLGFLLGAAPQNSPFPPLFFRQQVARVVRSSAPYEFVTFQSPFWDEALQKTAEWAVQRERELYRNDPAHPRVWAVLREAVVREPGGYVHPDLGLLHPAPSGAVRGIGMVRNSHTQCQSECFPRSTEPTQQQQQQQQQPPYKQEEILIRVPLSYQMTRTTALDLLVPLIPTNHEVHQRKAALLHELDDAALLVLQLAHERGVGRYSRWLPYIASLPPEPSCGYNRKLRPYMLDALAAYQNERGLDAEGWSDELIKAMHYAERIADGLKTDFGQYLHPPPAGVSVTENIQWALCQVASRATAGHGRHGSLRLVPVLDLINHDAAAGGFVELTGRERRSEGDFLDAASEHDSGTFVVRSLRHGRRKPLRPGQELLANYNVPHYSALDWFVSLGFVPPERWGPWVKVDPVLPHVRRDGPFHDDRPGAAAAEDPWKARDAQILQHLKNAEL